MSPEQLRGETIDHRADIFAAGAILFEMLTGKPAFSGNTPLAIYHAVLYEQPAALAGSEAITAVNRAILKSLAKKPDDRHPAASAMADELRAVLLTPDAGAPVSARPMRRLIVLPFRLLKPDPEIDFLAFSLAEAVAGSLSGLESLLVRSTLAAASLAGEIPDLKRIAAEAEVDMVLTGTLLKTGDQLRATTQLVEAPAGTLLWSHTSQTPLRDVFALETALTQRVVESLSLPLTEREQRLLKRDVPASPTAYEFYLRANQQSHGPQHWRVARDLLLRSVEEDPRYAPAWARLARCYWLIGKYTRDPDDNIKHAEEALQRALELNPDLAMAHNLYAHVEASSGRALNAMRRLITRARSRQSDPQVFAGLVIACRFCGLLEASVAAHEQARRLDPKIPTSVSHTFFMQGQYERGLEDAHLDIGYSDCVTLTMLGREQQAMALIRKRKRDEDLGHVGAWLDSIHAFIEGRHEDCLAAIKQLEAWFRDPEGLFYAARTLAQIGKERHALDLLRRSIAEGFHCFPAFVRDPWLDPLRTTAEFKQILLEAEIHHRIAVAAFIEEEGDRVLGVSLAS
jgi:TolB-like protein